MITEIGRHPERASHHREDLDQLLRCQPTGVLSSITDDGQPWAVPMLHALDGDRILFHGSTGAGLLRHIGSGAPVVYTVSILDAWVMGHTTFNSSANYRSATIRGSIINLNDDDKIAALDTFSNSIFPGRTNEVRPMSTKELAATHVCALSIAEGQWLYKTRAQGASQPAEDTTAWGGVIPVTRGLGVPRQADWSTATPPASLHRLETRTKN